MTARAARKAPGAQGPPGAAGRGSARHRHDSHLRRQGNVTELGSITQRQPGEPSVAVRCERCGTPVPPKTHGGGRPKKFCSKTCADKAKNLRTVDARKRQRQPGEPSVAVGRKRRPLPDAASDAAWALSKDVERIARIIADERFGGNKEKVAPLLRGHLTNAAQSCQELLGRIDTQQESNSER